MHRRKASRLFWCFLAVPLLAGCPKKPPETPGLILVGSPQIVTRERLLNDRLEEETWLKKQLDEADKTDFSKFQGASDVSTFVGTTLGVSINANPLEQRLYEQESDDYLAALERQRADAARQEEIARLDHEIALEKKRRELDKARAETQASMQEGQESDAAAGSGEAPERPEPPAAGFAPDTKAFAERLTDDKRERLLPTAATLALAEKVHSSPIDTFRDRLAYREEIRREILENNLDDRHDLGGTTLYRLTVPATIFPPKGTDEWAVVELEISPSARDLPSSQEWLEAYQADFQSRVAFHALQLDGCKVNEERECLLPDALAVRILRGPADCKPEPVQAIDFGPKRNRVNSAPPNLPRGALVSRMKEKLVGCGDSRSIIARALWAEEAELNELGKYVQLEFSINENKFALEFTRGGREGVGNALKHEGETRLYAYSVTPKESVQRLSEIEADRRAFELALSLGLLTGAGSLNTTLNRIEESRALTQEIRRQPLVVGFSRTTTTGAIAEGKDGQEEKVALGWIIGPRFDPQPGHPEEAGFSHIAIQNGLTAVVAVPAWWQNLDLSVKASWRENGNLKSRSAAEFQSATTTVAVPGNILAITDLLRKSQRPQVLESTQFEFVRDKPAQVLIHGSNLWRGTRVTVGSQSTTDIEVLSDMEGIIAKFGPITEPLGNDIPLRVWTSEGMVVAGNAVIVKEDKDEQKLAIKVVNSRLIDGSGEKIALKVTSGKLPAGFFRARVGIRPAGAVQDEFAFSEAALTDDGEISAPIPVLATKFPEGSKVDVTFQVQLRNLPGEKDIHLTPSQKPIYYPSVNSARVSVSGGGSVTLGHVLTLVFPKSAATAFPGLDADTRLQLKRGNQAFAPEPVSFDRVPNPWVYKVKVPTELVEKGDITIELIPNAPDLQLSLTKLKVK